MGPPPSPYSDEDYPPEAPAVPEDDAHAPLWTLMLEDADEDEDESCKTKPPVDIESGPTDFKSGGALEMSKTGSTDFSIGKESVVGDVAKTLVPRVGASTATNTRVTVVPAKTGKLWRGQVKRPDGGKSIPRGMDGLRTGSRPWSVKEVGTEGNTSNPRGLDEMRTVSNPWHPLVVHTDDERSDSQELDASCTVSNPGEWQTVKGPRHKNRRATFCKAPSLHFIECEPNLNRVAPEQDFWELVETHLDSGAARSVCPIDFCPEFPVTETGASKKQEHFRTATGGRVRNEGQRRISGVTENGIPVSMAYAVADIAVTLESVAQICDSGATVTFTAKGGRIDGPAGRVPFDRKGDAYVRKTWVNRRTDPKTKADPNKKKAENPDRPKPRENPLPEKPVFGRQSRAV